eukprot:3507241-Prymnesium_polylepis.1
MSASLTVAVQKAKCQDHHMICFHKQYGPHLRTPPNAHRQVPPSILSPVHLLPTPAEHLISSPAGRVPEVAALHHAAVPLPVGVDLHRHLLLAVRQLHLDRMAEVPVR